MDIKRAKTKPYHLYCEFIKYKTPKAANEDAVCPDGNEYDFGAFTSNLRPSIASKGLSLFTTFFKIPSPKTAVINSAVKYIIPNFLVFFLNI